MTFQHILADPAWLYNSRRETRKDCKKSKFGIGASTRYHCESTEQMATIPVESLAADVSCLWMWTTGPMLLDAAWLMEAWGFHYVTFGFVWVKCNPRPWAKPIRKLAEMLLVKNGLTAFLAWLTFYGPGFYTASNVEIVLLGRRGEPALQPVKCPRQLIFAPRTAHSRKPDAAHERIMAAYPGQTYAELFARRPFDGWTCFGDEIDGQDLRVSIPASIQED